MRNSGPFHAFGAALVLARKDFRVAASYRASFVLGYFTVVFSIVAFYFLSRVVGDNNNLLGGPTEYFRFLIVGLIVGGIVDTALSASIGAARRDQMQGTLEAVVSLPVGTPTLGLGWLLWPIASLVVSSSVAIAIALPLGLWGVSPSWGWLAISVTLTILLFSAIGLFGAALVIAFQQGTGAITLVMTALGVISGAVFPTTVMPPWLQTIASASPIKHALDASRNAAFGADTGSTIETSVLILGLFTAILLPFGLMSLEWALRRARKTGSLGKF